MRKSIKQRQGKALQKERSELRSAKRFHDLTKALGIAEELCNIGEKIQRLIFSPNPPVLVVLAPELKGNVEAEKIRKECEMALEKMTLKVTGLSDEFPLQDYFRYLKALDDNLNVKVVNQSTSEPNCFQRAKAKTNPLVENAMPDAAEQLHYGLEQQVLIKYSRMDKFLYWVRASSLRKDNRKYSVTMTLYGVQAEPASNNLIKCMQCNGGKCEWLKYPPKALCSQSEPLPVYVSTHAMDALNERALFVEDGHGYLCDAIFFSLLLAEKTYSTRERNRYLVEYTIFGWKLGYLVVEVESDRVVVVTFLFLTMEGTPEAEMLWRKLRLQRPDKEHLELDRIQTFLLTDISKDAELVKILSECGCGHLFKIMKPDSMPIRSGYANDVRRYLNLW